MEKKKFTIFFIITALCLFTTNQILTNSTGAPARHTGAPGEQNCGACHNSNSVNSGDGGLTVQVLENDNPVINYRAGRTYQIVIKLNAHSDQQTNLVGGFQVSAVGTTGASAGSWNINTGTMKMVQGLVNGQMRRYITHNSAQSFSKTTGITWEMEWTAPAESTGNIVFYAAGNSANNNMSNTGDFIYTASLSIRPAAVGIAENHSSSTSIKILGNSIHRALNLQVTTTQPNNVQFTLTSLKGQTIPLSGNREIMAGKNNFNFSTAGIAPGIYLLKMQGKNLQLSQKVMIRS